MIAPSRPDRETSGGDDDGSPRQAGKTGGEHGDGPNESDLRGCREGSRKAGRGNHANASENRQPHDHRPHGPRVRPIG